MKRAKTKGSTKPKVELRPICSMSQEEIDNVNSAINRDSTIMFIYADLLELTAIKVNNTLKKYGKEMRLGYKNKVDQIVALSKKTRRGVECMEDEHQEKFGEVSDAFYDLNYYVLELTGGRPDSIYKIIEDLKNANKEM